MTRHSILLVLATSFLFSAVRMNCAAERAMPLRVSISPMPVSAPALLARDLGWFRKAGIEVELKEYSLGKLALEDLSRGTLDLASAAVTPLVHLSLTGESFRIISTIASSTGMVAIVARKDAGITNLADLAGKRIGLSRGTSGEFFFDTLRVLQRVPESRLQVQDRSLEGLVEGMQDGSLDAASLWEPQLSELERALPGRFTYFYGNGLYTFIWNLAALPSTLKTRRNEIEKFLAVLNDVAQFIEKEPRDAQEQLKRLGSRGEDYARLLDQVRCRPTLGQDLLVQLEAEARWVMARGGNSNSPPNYLHFLDGSLLEQVQPNAVTLIK